MESGGEITKSFQGWEMGVMVGRVEDREMASERITEEEFSSSQELL